MKKLTRPQAIGALSILIFASTAIGSIIWEAYYNSMDAAGHVLYINCGPTPYVQPCWNRTVFSLSASYENIANEYPGTDWYDTYYAVALDIFAYYVP